VRVKLFSEKTLTAAIIGGIVLGAALGLAAQQAGPGGLQNFVNNISILGDVFLAALKMVVVPLVLFSVTAGVANLGGGNEVGRRLFKTLGFFLITSFLAVLVGMVYTNVIAPGRGKDTSAIMAQIPAAAMESARNQQGKIALEAPEDLQSFIRVQVGNLLMNPFKSLAEMNLIGVVFFSLVLGFAIMLCGERGEAARRFFSAMNEALMKMVGGVIWLAPLGIFALTSKLLMNLGPDVIRPLSLYFLTVVLGLGTHLFVVYPLILLTLCKFSPLRFFNGMKEAILFAISTSSSSATLPVTMRCVEDNLGVDAKSANFVLPMGSTVNMDGTALYEAAAVMFIAQMLGMPLDITQQFIVFFTATLAAIGAAGIPQAGLVTMVVVFNALKIPLEFMALIIVVDRPLDHMRTVVNICGDAVGAIFLSHSEGELNRTR